MLKIFFVVEGLDETKNKKNMKQNFFSAIGLAVLLITFIVPLQAQTNAEDFYHMIEGNVMFAKSH